MKWMTVGRIVLGIIFWGGAVTNITLPSISGVDSYHPFMDQSFIPFYKTAWDAIVVPNMLLFIILTVVFEIMLGTLFIFFRRYLKIALILGIVFALGVMPVMIQAIGTNIPLAAVQAFMLWKEIRRDKAVDVA